ncbi:PqqD family protein [Bacteroides sp. AN502(2024)]|uniref:PqqD family protein n=1 Tax=Bacteroides sp. AN502(2024) TaxID=3160599 RepID=UPI0035187B71
MAAKEKINLLEVIPCRSEHITAEREGETIVLSFPRFKHPWMQRFLVPKGMSKELHVRLEEHGTAVWELIDGKRTVREIIEELAVHFQHEEGYESRVSAYLSQMQKDGLIKLMVPVV